MSKVVILLVGVVLFMGFISAEQVCEVYDDFNLSALNDSKWEIRQDVEGQNFTDEYWVDANLSNYHIRQNVTGERGTYLFAKRNFTTGDVLEYSFNVVSREGNYGQMVLLTGDQYMRIGVMGYNNGIQGFDELGEYHVRIEFGEDSFRLERISPSNVSLVDNLGLVNVNGTYELYVGSFSGEDGVMHMDFDDFTLCVEEEESLEPFLPNCSDGILNQNETDIDCGGECLECVILEVNCSDGIQNQNETGVDCGGECSACEVEEANCSDGILNQNETEVDCGGECSACEGGEPTATCEEILSLKPGKSKGLLKNGCSPGVLNVFSKKIGWAKDK